MTKILITGAAGLVGSILRTGLADHDVLGLDQRDAEVIADTTDLAAIVPAFSGREVVIDLAAHAAIDTPWDDVYRNNIPSTLNVLEAARTSGVRRVVFASSNHAVGLYERDSPYAEIVAGRYEGLDPATIDRIGADAEIRPDGPYGLGKAAGEAAARYYAEAHGLSVHCLRIGTVNREDRPLEPRHFATLLTHGDLVRLVEACIADGPRFGIFYGVSRNTWRFWQLPRSIAYEPADNAEEFR